MHYTSSSINALSLELYYCSVLCALSMSCPLSSINVLFFGTCSDVYNDSTFQQTDSGDYLLMSPSGQSLAAELDQGIIVEEEG